MTGAARVQQQPALVDVLLRFVALVFVLDVDRWLLRSSLLRPHRHTLTHHGEVRHLESRRARAQNQTEEQTAIAIPPRAPPPGPSSELGISQAKSRLLARYIEESRT